MKNILTTLTLIFSFAIAANAQPAIQWEKTFGGTGDDYANCIQQTFDGGYIIAGISTSNNGDVTGNHGSEDYWVVKLTSTQTIEWQKSFGGTAKDDAYSVQQTTDSGFIVAGYSQSTDGDVTDNHGQYDYWVVKLFANGNVDWKKSFGGTGYDYANSIQQTDDGGYIVAGESNSTDDDVTGNHGALDYWIVKLTSSGSIDWQKSFGGTLGEYANSVKQTNDGGYIVAGRSDSNDGDVTDHHDLGDFWILKLFNNGIVDWKKSFGGSNDDFAYSIEQTTDSGYIVAGLSNSGDGDVSSSNHGADYWVLKLSHAGVIEWEKPLGGSTNEWAFSVQQTADGSYIAAGRANSTDFEVTGNHGNYDYWVTKLTSAGVIDWKKSLGGTGDDEAFCIQQTTDGGYVVAGSSTSTDGDVTGNHGGYGDYWLVKLFPDNNSGLAPIDNENDLTLYPNPADEFLVIKNSFARNETVTVKFFDVAGREIYSSLAKTSNLKLETQNLENGIYFCQLKSTDKIFNQKFIVQH